MIINFNPVRFNTNTRNISNNKGINHQKSTNLAPLKQDTVSFSGRIPKDLLDLSPEKILAVCKRAVRDNIVIGEGQEAIAYKIQDYPQYCIRYEKKSGDTPANFGLNYKLNKYDRVNHVILKLGKGTQLMKYISGIPLKIMPHRDTPDGIQVKKAVQGLVANNFPESSFKKVISQIEDAKSKGIDFDRKGENLLVEAVNQEITCIDFSPNFHDVEYNPISYVYSAMDVDNTEHAAKIFGKLCKAYAQRLYEVPVNKLNIDSLDTNFYHRGFMDEPFNYFPDRKILAETQKRLENLIKEKQNPENSKEYIEYLVQEFKDFIDEKVMTIKPNNFISPSFD